MNITSAHFGCILSLIALLLSPMNLPAQAGLKQRSVLHKRRITTCTPEDLAGLVKYDPKEAAKKVGIDSRAEFYGQFCKLVEEHNKSANEIVDDNWELFGNLYLLKAESENLATEQQDFTPLVELIRLMEAQLLPIAGLVEEEAEYLNVLMGHILDDRQFRRWERYQDKVKKSKEPKYPRPMAGPLLVE